MEVMTEMGNNTLSIEKQKLYTILFLRVSNPQIHYILMPDNIPLETHFL
jgi:hypothetical protein